MAIINTMNMNKQESIEYFTSLLNSNALTVNDLKEMYKTVEDIKDVWRLSPSKILYETKQAALSEVINSYTKTSKKDIKTIHKNNIEPKLNIGSTMYSVKQNIKKIKVQCPYCNGTGITKVTEKGCSPCLSCELNGYFKVPVYGPWQMSEEPKVIKKIETITTEDGTVIKYFTDENDDDFDFVLEENAFDNSKEATNIAISRNRKMYDDGCKIFNAIKDEIYILSQNSISPRFIELNQNTFSSLYYVLKCKNIFGQLIFDSENVCISFLGIKIVINNSLADTVKIFKINKEVEE